MDLQATKRDLEELEKLLASRGWAVISEHLGADIQVAALNIGDDPRMTLEQIQYLRGRLSAAKDFLRVPHMISNRLTNDLALVRPAKAGQKE